MVVLMIIEIEFTYILIIYLMIKSVYYLILLRKYNLLSYLP